MRAVISAHLSVLDRPLWTNRRLMMPGKKKGMKSIKNRKQYERLKEKGFSKSSAAAISNASYNKGKGKHKKKR
jgi:hypothetical protein